jgi:hypothetical protein
VERGSKRRGSGRPPVQSGGTDPRAVLRAL